MHFADLPPDLILWLSAVWLTAMGGAVGSFLNVVVYRVPAGMNIAWPASHCPKCKEPIRWKDNVPVFGWLLLRGRCRDCGTRISARYPAVEATCAATFLFLAVVVLYSGGMNFPLRPVAVAGGSIAVEPTLGRLAGIYGFHLLLLCTLLAAALIEYDGHPLPARLFLPALVVGLAAPLVWPWLRPVPALAGLEGWTAGLVDGAAGLLAGCAAGGLVAMAVGRQRPARLWLGPACVGLFLGPQAVVLLGAATGLVQLAARLVRRPLTTGATLWVLSIAWIVAWRHIVTAWPMVG